MNHEVEKPEMEVSIAKPHNSIDERELQSVRAIPRESSRRNAAEEGVEADHSPVQLAASPQISSRHRRDPSVDVEQGIVEDGPSNQPSGSEQKNDYFTSPVVTIIDVDSEGKRTPPSRIRTQDYESQDQSVPDGCVRIICKEVGEINKKEMIKMVYKSKLTRKMMEEGNDTSKPIRIAEEVKELRLSDFLLRIFKPFEETVGGVSCLDNAKRRFNIQKLHELWRRAVVQGNSDFIVQTNLQQSAFPENTKIPGPRNETRLISSPHRVHNAFLTMSSQFWKAFVEVGVRWMEGKAECESQ